MTSFTLFFNHLRFMPFLFLHAHELIFVMLKAINNGTTQKERNEHVFEVSRMRFTSKFIKTIRFFEDVEIRGDRKYEMKENFILVVISKITQFHCLACKRSFLRVDAWHLGISNNLHQCVDLTFR